MILPKSAEFVILDFNVNSGNVVNFINEKGYSKRLQSNDNIIDIRLHYNNEDDEIKTITSKEKINQVMDTLYKSPEGSYGRQRNNISIEINMINGDTSWVEINKNGSENVIRLFE